MIFISLTLLSEYESLTAGTDYSFQCNVDFLFFYDPVGKYFWETLVQNKTRQKEGFF